MIKSYFILAIRNIKRYPMHSILNISGMAIGMACALLLLLWVRNELSYDRFYSNADELFRVLQSDVINGKPQQFAATPFALAGVLKDKYPEIIRSTRYNNIWTSFPKGENVVEGTLAYVDRDFFDMFDIEFIQGEARSAFTKPNDFVLTEDMAKKYFGDEDPMGKTIVVWPNYSFTVSGVIRNVPRNSHFYIDCLVPYSFYITREGGNMSILDSWNPVYNYTFIELAKGVDSRNVENEIQPIIQDHVKDSRATVFLQNIQRIHLYSHGLYAYDIESGNIMYVRLAALLAVLILLIACINYINLATAQSARRLKEIGLRKVAGAGKSKIALQFLGESLIMVFIAHVLAMILLELSLPGFNMMMHSSLKVNYLDPKLYACLLAFILICGLLAGGYPAFHLAGSNPLEPLRGALGRPHGSSGFRRALVISQFTLSFLFIMCTLIVGKQLGYMQNESLGLNIENVGRFEFTEGIRRETLKNELAGNPDIEGVTITAHQNVLNTWSAMDSVRWNGKKEAGVGSFRFLEADRDFAGTFHIDMKEGRFLGADETYANADTNVIQVVINEKAQGVLGFEDPMGEELRTPFGETLRIIGVVRDFHFQTLRFAIEPLIIMPIRSGVSGGTCYFRVKPGRFAPAAAAIRDLGKAHLVSYPLNAGFLRDDYNFLYLVERIAAVVFKFMTFLALVISCLGLAGLSTFMTTSRTKEIGIRKANGARSFEIFTLLSKEYFILVTLSFLIALPVAWYATNVWLQGYAYRIEPGLVLFASSWILVMAVTFLTVGFQTRKASRQNPVDALRYE